MPETFKFERTNTRVVKHLSALEIGGVAVWQNTDLNYEFEFHNGHELGHPVYMREGAINLTSNLPKIDTLNRTFDTVRVVNEDQINSPACLADFTNVVRNNIALFQKLTKAYYEGEIVAPKSNAVKIVKFTCSKRGGPDNYVKAPTSKESMVDLWFANARSKLKKPKCTMHKNDACIGSPELVTITLAESIKQTRRYDDNYDVQG